MTRNAPHPPRGTLPFAGRDGEGVARSRSVAKKLRAIPTASEVRLWRTIYGLRIDGYHFRKQVRIGSYIVDFASIHAGLVIEVDGLTHETELAQRNDAVRDDYLRGRGFTVLRFSSRDVMEEPDGVFATVAAALADRPRNHRGSAPPSPTLPARGRVPASDLGAISSSERNSTSPLAGEAGRGGATCSNPKRGTD